MVERTFVIQRYCRDNWSHVKGLTPFIATGPKFKQWVIQGSLEKSGSYRIIKTLRSTIEKIGDGAVSLDAIAELFLREGIVQALWSVNSIECLPKEERWSASIDQVVREIGGPSIAEDAIELLSGLSDPQHFRSYVSDDCLTLEQEVPPNDGY